MSLEAGQQGTEPQGTEPQGTEPQGTEPQGTEPQGTEPQAVKYDISFGEKSDGWHEDALKQFTELASEFGLSQEHAQKLASWIDEHAGYSYEDLQTAHNTVLDEMQSSWEKEITSRPQYKAELERAKNVLSAFGGPELVDILNKTRLGSNPVLFDFFSKVGKALAEPELYGKNFNKPQEVPLMDRLWKD